MTPKKKFRETPLMPLFLTASSVFVAECISMALSRFLDPSNSELTGILIDACLLVVLLSPAFHFFLSRPLSRLANERKLAEEALQAAKKRLHQIVLETTMDAIWLYDADGRIQEVNPSLCKLFGHSRDELLTMTVWDVFRDVDYPAIRRFHGELLARGFSRNEAAARLKNGRRIEVEISAAYSKWDDRTYVFFRDISELKENERRLRKAKEQLEAEVDKRTAELKTANEQLAMRSAEIETHNREITAIGKMGELLSSCDNNDEAYVVIARSISQFFPRDAGALFVLNESHNLLVRGPSWGDDATIHKEVDPRSCWALRRGRCYAMEDLEAGLECPHLATPGHGHFCLPLMAHGETLGVLHLLLGSPEVEEDHEDSQNREFRLFSNIAEKTVIALANLRLSETLRNLSIRDPLSGLYNRRFMEEAMEREYALALRDGTPLGIIMFDIDHFKRFNDTFGHDAGDAVIRELSAAVKRHVRGCDIACRYGGEEFAIIMPGATAVVAVDRAEALRSEAAQLQLQHDHRSVGSVTLSLGVAVFPEHAPNAEAAFRAADAALYRAKNSGRNRVVACDRTAAQKECCVVTDPCGVNDKFLGHSA